MIESRAAGAKSSRSMVDPTAITKLPLPSHVTVLANGNWQRGWLIGRSHEAGGWMGLVQYENRQGQEVIEQIRAEYIVPAGCRPAP